MSNQLEDFSPVGEKRPKQFSDSDSEGSPKKRLKQEDEVMSSDSSGEDESDSESEEQQVAEIKFPTLILDKIFDTR